MSHGTDNVDLAMSGTPLEEALCPVNVVISERKSYFALVIESS